MLPLPPGPRPTLHHGSCICSSEPYRSAPDYWKSRATPDCRGAQVYGSVRTARFTAWNNKASQLTAQGVKLTGINATVAQDLEPEYATFAAGERIAFVGLQVRAGEGGGRAGTGGPPPQVGGVREECVRWTAVVDRLLAQCLTVCRPIPGCRSAAHHHHHRVAQENNAIAVLDVERAVITAIHGLGFKNHSLPYNALDPTDQPKEAKIGTWPVYGMYQPDEMRSFR